MSNEQTEGESLTFRKTFVKSNLPFHGEYLTYQSLASRGLLTLKERETGFQSQRGNWLIFDDLGELEVVASAPNAQSRRVVDGVLERFELAQVRYLFGDIGGETMVVSPIDRHLEIYTVPLLVSLGRFFSLSDQERRRIQGLKVQRFIDNRLNRVTQNKLMRELLLGRYSKGISMAPEVEAFENQMVQAVLVGAMIGGEPMDQESYRSWVEKICGEAIDQTEQGIVMPPRDRESIGWIVGYRSPFDGEYHYRARPEAKAVDEEDRKRLKASQDHLNLTYTPERIKRETLGEIGVREPWIEGPMTLDEKRRYLIYQGLIETNLAWSLIESAWRGGEDRMVDLMHFRPAGNKPSRLSQLRLLSRAQQIANLVPDALFGNYHMHQEELDLHYKEILVRGIEPVSEIQTRAIFKKIVGEVERTMDMKRQIVEELLSLPF